MMLDELNLLLTATTEEANYSDYQVSVVLENTLLKSTEATRQKSFRYLRELYGLKPELVLFRALRSIWTHAGDSRPLVAILCAVARDPLLRATTKTIINAPEGMAINDEDFAESVKEELGARLNANILAKVGRNTASSWTQSGHLQGRTKKVRSRVESNPTSTAYALLLAYLTGYRGETLFDNDWVRLLDTPAHILHEHAQQAAQQGWLEYRRSGTITDITFRYFLKDSL